jgi:hypothetical protein
MKTKATETTVRNTLTSAPILAACFLTGCGGFSPAVVAPPPVPAKTIPELRVEPGPIPEKGGRVVLDSVGAPSTVVEVVDLSSAVAYAGRYTGVAHGETTRPVCTTPCAADLPFGAHMLRFEPIGNEDEGETNVMVDVGAKPSVYRVAPGYQHVNAGGRVSAMLLEGFGLTGVITGGSMLTVAATDDRAYEKFGTASIVTLGVGAGLLGIGILVDYLSRGEVRHESSVRWTPGVMSDGSVTTSGLAAASSRSR